MKNNTPTGIDKFVQPLSIGARVIPLLVALVSAVLTQPLFAQVVAHDIQITENSSTSLSATYDGSTTGVTVTFLGTDQWGVTFPSTVTFSLLGGVNWLEPGSSTLGNEVTFFRAGNGLGVVSDTSLFGSTTTGNGTKIDNVGTDSSNGGSISATFHDNGDVARAPDAGSTVGLLFLALTALFSASRLRHVQLA